MSSSESGGLLSRKGEDNYSSFKNIKNYHQVFEKKHDNQITCAQVTNGPTQKQRRRGHTSSGRKASGSTKALKMDETAEVREC